LRFSDLRQCLDLSVPVLKRPSLSAIAIAIVIVIVRRVVKDGLRNGQRKIQNDQMTGAAAAAAAVAADDENVGPCEWDTKNVSEMERNDRCDNNISF
jgi:hypothetical protein